MLTRRAVTAGAFARAVRWTHYPLYYMDFRSDNLAFT